MPIDQLMELLNDPAFYLFLTYIVKDATGFMLEPVKKKIGEKILKKSSDAWDRFKIKIQKDPEAAKALEKFKAEPDNADLRKLLLEKFDEVLESDSELKGDIEKLGKDLTKQLDKILGSVKEVHGDVKVNQQLILALAKELGIDLQLNVGLQTVPEPTEEAKELAEQIPEDADSYSLALKAIANEDYEKAWELLDTAQEEQDIKQRDLYLARGRTKFYQGRYLEAYPWYEKALALCQDDIELLFETSVVFLYSGKYNIAEQVCMHMQKIVGDTQDDHPEDYATSLINLAFLYCDQGRYKEAEPLINQALEIEKKILGEEHPSYATSLNNLADLYCGQGRYKEAEPLYKQALEIKGNVLGEEHPSYATSLNNLAGLYCDQGRYKEAEPLQKKDLEVTKKVLGENHPDYATSLNNLADLYCNQGRYKEAEPLYKQALEIWKKVFGEEHPDYSTCLENYIGLLDKMGRPDEAEKMRAEAQTVLEKHRQRNTVEPK